MNPVNPLVTGATGGTATGVLGESQENYFQFNVNFMDKFSFLTLFPARSSVRMNLAWSSLFVVL